MLLVVVVGMVAVLVLLPSRVVQLSNMSLIVD